MCNPERTTRSGWNSSRLDTNTSSIFMAPLERSWEKMNRLAWGAFNWPHCSSRKAQSTQWEEKEEALSLLAVGGWQGPHQSLCPGQAGFRLSGPWLQRPKVSVVLPPGGRGSVTKPTNQNPKPQPNRNTDTGWVLHALVKALPMSTPRVPGKRSCPPSFSNPGHPCPFPVA